MTDRERADAQARQFFDRLWSEGDPWDLESHPFEIAKYEAQLAVLDADRGPGRQFGRALEIGCAAGAFTRRLAPRCAQVVGIDIAQGAIELARAHDGAERRVPGGQRHAVAAGAGRRLGSRRLRRDDVLSGLAVPFL